MLMKKILLIGIIAGLIETIIWYLLSNNKNKIQIMLVTFFVYTAAYVVIAELERNIPEDDGNLL